MKATIKAQAKFRIGLRILKTGFMFTILNKTVNNLNTKLIFANLS